jgi:PTS system nitrogen regulatory IIA component
MALAEHLCESAICLCLEAAQRDEAIRVLLERFVAGGAMPAGLVDRVLEVVLDRERLGSTAIGKGVAVPHARLRELDRILVGFGRSEAGVEFSALDGQPVHQVFLVVAPREGADEYLDIMQRITRLVQNDDFRRFVGGAETERDVVALIEEMDG